MSHFIPYLLFHHAAHFVSHFVSPTLSPVLPPGCPFVALCLKLCLELCLPLYILLCLKLFSPLCLPLCRPLCLSTQRNVAQTWTLVGNAPPLNLEPSVLLLGCRAGICHQVFEAVAAFFTGLHTHTHTLPGTTTAGPDAKFPSVPKGWKGTNSPWLFWTANCVQFRNRGHLKAVYIAFNSQRGSIKFHLQHLQDIFSKNLSPHCYYVAPHCLSMSCAFRINSFRLRSLDRAQELLQLILDSGVSLSLFQRSRFCLRCVGS